MAMTLLSMPKAKMPMSNNMSSNRSMPNKMPKTKSMSHAQCANMIKDKS